MLGHLFPFLTSLNEPRDVTSAPNGFYRPAPSRSDDNRRNIFETTVYPPSLSMVGSTGFYAPESPGPSQPALILTAFQIPNSPTIGGLLVNNYTDENPLGVSPDSIPEVELF